MPNDPNWAEMTTLRNLAPLFDTSGACDDTAQAFRNMSIYLVPTYFLFNICPAELKDMEKMAMDHMIREYKPFDSHTMCDEDNTISIPTNKYDATLLVYVMMCAGPMRSALLLTVVVQHSQVSEETLMAPIKPCDGKKGGSTGSMPSRR